MRPARTGPAAATCASTPAVSWPNTHTTTVKSGAAPHPAPSGPRTPLCGCGTPARETAVIAVLSSSQRVKRFLGRVQNALRKLRPRIPCELAPHARALSRATRAPEELEPARAKPIPSGVTHYPRNGRRVHTCGLGDLISRLPVSDREFDLRVRSGGAPCQRLTRGRRSSALRNGSRVLPRRAATSSILQVRRRQLAGPAPSLRYREYSVP